MSTIAPLQADYLSRNQTTPDGTVRTLTPVIHSGESYHSHVMPMPVRAPIVPISVIIPTWRRTDELLKTLGKLYECTPLPDEILVHVDAADEVTLKSVRAQFPHVRIGQSSQTMGPGGGRTKLMKKAKHEVVVSFDDDSWPVDHDFFSRVSQLAELFPAAAVFSCRITHRGEKIPPASSRVCPTVHFVGCGVAYRRHAFLEAGGYLPVQWAYGIEELDLALRLLDRGQRILECHGLRVFHDTDLGHHARPEITAAHIRNTALLVWLRYPLLAWPYGVLQVLNRVAYSLRRGRWRGVLLALSPRHAGQVQLPRRHPLRLPTLWYYLQER